jgi:hypothetical protein
MKRRGSLFALGLLVLSTVSAAQREEQSIRQRVAQIRGSDTTAWQRIPWAPSLLEASRAGQHEDHPVFVFTHDGNIDTGRC